MRDYPILIFPFDANEDDHCIFYGGLRNYLRFSSHSIINYKQSLGFFMSISISIGYSMKSTLSLSFFRYRYLS